MKHTIHSQIDINRVRSSIDENSRITIGLAQHQEQISEELFVDLISRVDSINERLAIYLLGDLVLPEYQFSEPVDREAIDQYLDAVEEFHHQVATCIIELRAAS